MGTLFPLTVFLAVALLGIVITVFVLAVSLLGRAIRIAVEEQAKAEKGLKENNEKEMAKIQGEFNQAKAEGKQPDIESLGNTLEGLKKKNREHKRKLRWINIKPKLLTATWGALVPGAFFLISLIFSALGLYVQATPLGLYVQDDMATLYVWLALIALGIGIVFIGLTLKVIEGVAITSEETSFVRQKEVFTTALKEIEQEKKPELRLLFRGQYPPFHVKVDTELKLEFGVGLTKGEVAEDVFAGFHVPSGFSFPGMKSTTQNPDHPTIPNFVTARVDFGTITKGTNIIEAIVIKAPPKAGQFLGYYYLRCRGFAGEDEKFEIVVEEPDIPSTN